MTLRWYAAHTRPMAEYAVAHGLERAGYEVFFPRVRTPYPRPGRGDAPLFPGYLFVRYDGDSPGLLSIGGASQGFRLVAFGGAVAPVPDQVVFHLQERLDSLNASGGLWRTFQPGEKVRVRLGPTDTLAEVVAQASPQERVQVLLQLLGRHISVDVPWQSVRPASTSELGERGGRCPPPPRRTRGRGRWIQGHGPLAMAHPEATPRHPEQRALSS